MGVISLNFDREEFECPCGCGFDTVDAELLVVAEYAREYTGAYSPNSACRCEKHNKAIGGSKGSWHMKARAIDIPCKNPEGLYKHLDSRYPATYGLGLYSWGVHIDTRPTRARWRDVR